MVNQSTVSLEAIFGALADPTRRALLERLRHGPVQPSALAGPLGVSRPAISKHLRVLERAQLVRREKLGRDHLLHIAAAPLDDAARWIAEHRAFWERQLDSLERYLDAQDASTPEVTACPPPKPVRRSRSRSTARFTRARRKSSPRGRKPRR